MRPARYWSGSNPKGPSACTIRGSMCLLRAEGTSSYRARRSRAVRGRLAKGFLVMVLFLRRLVSPPTSPAGAAVGNRCGGERGSVAAQGPALAGRGNGDGGLRGRRNARDRASRGTGQRSAAARARGLLARLRRHLLARAVGSGRGGEGQSRGDPDRSGCGA